MINSIEYKLSSTMECLGDLKSLNPDWDVERIYDKTGINQRYVSTSKETALSLATEAGKALIKNKKLNPDGLIYVSQTPDSLISGTAFLLHAALELPASNFIYDVNHGCAGFVYGLALAVSHLSMLRLDHCLLVCSEVYSKHILKNDRTCRPIFSDAACAAFISRTDVNSIGPFVFYTDGNGAKDLMLKKTEQGDHLFMDGARVLLFTMAQVPKAVNELLSKAELTISNIDLFIFHQASKVVLDNIQRILNISDDKMYRQNPSIGNTVSATIGIALKTAQESEIIKPGMTLLLMGFGVGLSLAGCIYRT